MFVRGGACSLARPHQLRLWCGRHNVLGERGPRWFGRKLDGADSGEHPGEAFSETHLRVGNDRGYPRGYLARGSNED